MKKSLFISVLFLFFASEAFTQSIDDTFPQNKMRKDLKIFKNIRLKANSGVYKYRTKKQIDSIYNWANNEISKSHSKKDFYNIICKITDFEGSLHNDTSYPKKLRTALRNEKSGYFPYLIKWIDGKWLLNTSESEIPLGSEIISINDENINSTIENLYKYYTTDGTNTTGKRIGIDYNFAKYYRLHYGLNNNFKIRYKAPKEDKIETKTLESVSYKDYYKNTRKRHSKPYDKVNYKDWKEDEIYSYKQLDSVTGILTINSFSLGNEEEASHKKYVAFLDATFKSLKDKNIKNLIVDLRYNGGGTDPNDLVTYSYLTNRNFSENKQAYISFQKIPYLRYIKSNVPSFLRFLGVGKYNKWFQKEFYIKKENGFYQGKNSKDHKVRTPKKNAFNGTVYLLVSPRIASAGSLFGAMVAGNENTIVVGEETMGGYYGHNGHTSLTYILPKSKIETTFSIVNLEQDVPKKVNQKYDKGIIPDYKVTQSFDDYLNQTDTQLNFVLDLIKGKK